MQIDMKRLESALRNAHSAGDRVAAKKLANAIKAQREVQPEASIGHKVGAVIDGLAQGLTLGFSDEIAGGLQTGFGMFGDYEAARDAERARMAENKRMAGGYELAGQIAGGFAGGAGLFKSGITASKFIPKGVQGGKAIAASTGANVADGIALGAGSALGTDQNMLGGAALGGALGAAAVPISGAVKAGGNYLGGLLGIGNKSRAQAAIVEALERSGKDKQQLAQEMQVAGGEFTLADALGNSGQRMLAGVARMPGDSRQGIREFLDSRQSGQGRRIVNAAQDAFGVSTTANEMKSNMSSARRAVGDMLYDASREGAGAVDVSGVIREIDAFNRPGVMSLADDGISGDSVMRVLDRARNVLTDGKSMVSNFDRALRVKQDLGDMIEAARRQGANNKARMLGRVSSRLDSALESASPLYRNANDRFREASQTIEAADIGRSAFGRGRAEDKIASFSRLPKEQKEAFRTGYADRLIENVDRSAVGADKSRPLINDALAKELPAFSKSSGLPEMLKREQLMFQTRNEVLGGSKTADNLADMAEIQSVDPSVIANLLMGRFGTAATQGATKAIQHIQGRNTQTRDLIADALLSGSNGSNLKTGLTPAAGKLLNEAVEKNTKAKLIEAMLAKSAIAGGTAAAN